MTSEYNKRYHTENRDKINARKREWYLANKEKKLAYRKSYYESNKSNINNKDKLYKLNKYKTSPGYKLLRCLRSRLTSALKGATKSKDTLTLLGCSQPELLNYLESKFLPGMAWNNHGLWHIDHIVPCCKFDMTDSIQQAKCFHYSNLQPLWATDNLKKGSKYAFH